MEERTSIRIATRQSPLALWQAQWVAQQLQQQHPWLTVKWVPIKTQGDQDLQLSLDQVTQGGLFVQALEEALLKQQADLAVHSVKDLPMNEPDGLCWTTFGEREDAREALIAYEPTNNIAALPLRARVGTSSRLRQRQLAHLRPDLVLKPLRGDITSRLQCWQDGEYEALILAVAGLKRLGLAADIQSYLPGEQMLTAPGQGALGVQSRDDDQWIQTLIAPRVQADVQACVLAERAVLRELAFDTTLAIGAYAQPQDNGWLRLHARIVLVTGEPIQGIIEGSWDFAENLGQQLAKQLYQQESLGDSLRCG